MRRVLVIGVAAALAVASFGAGLVARGDSETSDTAAGPGVSPQTFERVASGVALIGIRDCAGKLIRGPDGNEGSGTGFLIGSRVLMTAEHVVLGATSHPRACGIRARLSAIAGTTSKRPERGGIAARRTGKGRTRRR